jgi:hypothetical protein
VKLIAVVIHETEYLEQYDGEVLDIEVFGFVVDQVEEHVDVVLRLLVHKSAYHRQEYN